MGLVNVLEKSSEVENLLTVSVESVVVGIPEVASPEEVTSVLPVTVGVDEMTSDEEELMSI